MLLKVILQVLIFFRILWLTTCRTDCFCYKFNTKRLSWTNSQNECRKDGGNLVSMETEDKWKFINSEIQKIDEWINEWHIGLEKKGTEWKWVNNQRLTIDKWQRRGSTKIEPNGDGRCAAMAKNYPPGTQGLFKELSCTLRFMYICENRKGTSSCKRYYPSNCNETQSASKTTRLPLSTTPQSMIKTIPILTTAYKKQIKTTNPNAPITNLVSSTMTTEQYMTHSAKSSTTSFYIMLVVIVLGILLAGVICLFLVVCFWKRKTGKSKHGEDSRRKATSPASPENTCLDGTDARDSSMAAQITQTDAVVYAEIPDDQRLSHPETATYAEVHDYISPGSSAPKYPQPCENTPDNKFPGSYESIPDNSKHAYQSLDKSPGQDVFDPKDAPPGEEVQDGESKTSHNEQPIQEVVYATVDKSKKTKPVDQQVEAVYAQVDKSRTTEKNNFSS